MLHVTAEAHYRGAANDKNPSARGEPSPKKITLPQEIAGIRLPANALAQKAVDLAYRVSPPVVWTHVVRTFVFGSLVGQAQNLLYNEELFFLAVVLHDFGRRAIRSRRS
jgi:hypothetical protein